MQGSKLPSTPVLKVRASEVIGNPLANSYRVSEVIGNPLTNSPKDIGNFSKLHMFARGLPTHSNLWPEGIDYPPEQLSEDFE